ncbi:MAG TPA: phosphatase PAP2 family protein [Terracidiphilus sp.]|nr:phosphatase PAP2 family protein [Terracidiphilus sp.]
MQLLSILFNPAFQGILVLAFSIWWMLRKPEDRTRPWLVLALVLNLFYGFLLTTFMTGEGSLLPWKYDHILYHLDQSLGIHAASIARPLQGAWRLPLLFAYQAMIPMMVLWFLVTDRYGKRGSVVPAYAAELAVGPLLYSVAPGCGPIYAFGAQWPHPAAVPADMIRLSGMPNAFPSLHAATALILVLFAPTRLARSFALVFLAATLMATLSTGEHYLIDLVPGLAFGVFAASVGLLRFRQAAGFLFIASSWTFTVRIWNAFLIAHPLLLRSSVALTLMLVAIAIWKEWRSRPCAAALEAASGATTRRRRFVMHLQNTGCQQQEAFL